MWSFPRVASSDVFIGSTCRLCRKPIAASLAVVCAACVALNISETEESAGHPEQTVAATHEARELPHTELMQPQFRPPPRLVFTTNNGPVSMSGSFGETVLRAVDPDRPAGHEREEQPHTELREVDHQLRHLSMASIVVTGDAASYNAEQPSANAATDEPTVVFLNRAERRDAERRERRRRPPKRGRRR